MALILPGPLISDIRGKVADVVFERNAGGLYVRSKGIVTQEQSDPRDAARAALEYLSSRYRTVLTNAQKLAWSTYAASYPDTDRWGHPKVRTGQQTYIHVSYHFTLAYPGNSIDQAPSLPPLPKTIIDASIVASHSIITFPLPPPNWTATPGEYVIVVYQGTPVNTTRNFFAGPWRFAAAQYYYGPGWDPNFYQTGCFVPAAGKTTWLRVHWRGIVPPRSSIITIVKAVNP